MTTSPPPKRRGRPSGADSASTRAEILAAARRRFAYEGYEAASIAAICTDAHVTAPTVYHHFGSKAGLYIATLADVDARLHRLVADLLADEPTFAEALTNLVDESQRLHTEDPSIAGFLSAATIDLRRFPQIAGGLGIGLDDTGVVPPRPGSIRDLLDQAVRRAVDNGELSDAADPEGLVQFLLAVTLGVALFTTVVEPSSAKRLFAQWRLVMTGELLAPPSPDADGA